MAQGAGSRGAPIPGDRDELIGLLWSAARKGNVPAMRILLEDIDKDANSHSTKPTSHIDELAKRRKGTAG